VKSEGVEGEGCGRKERKREEVGFEREFVV
jgi:hypothetical protein